MAEPLWRNLTNFREVKERSYKVLESERRHRAHLLRAYVGNHYGRGSTKNTPVNLVNLYADTMKHRLAPSQPRVAVSTRVREYKLSAQDLELAVNEVLRYIDYEDTLRLVVFDSLIGLGIVKIGITDDADDELHGFMHEAGRIFIDTVDLDDFVWDTEAKRWEEIRFCGNKYKMHRDDIQEHPDFNEQAKRSIKQEITETAYRLGGSQSEMAENLSKGPDGLFPVTDERQEKEYLELWDMWFPRDQVVVTFADTGGRIPLRVMEWEGPKKGPYRLMRFNLVPNNIMPLPPAANLIDIHDQTNRMWNKLSNQASRQKTVTYAQGQAREDGMRVVKSSDGDTILMNNPQGVREVRFGGPDQTTLAMSMQNRQLFSYLAGNLDSLGGLSAQADTLGQEKLMESGASQRVRNMQSVVAAFTRECAWTIAEYLWNDKLINIPLTHRIRGTTIDVETSWPYQEDENGNEQDLRKGELNAYNFSVQPYSLQDQTPGQKLQAIRMIWQQDIIPAVQMGLTDDVPDLKAYLSQLSKQGNWPELDDLIQTDSGIGMRPAINSNTGARQSPTSQRNYVRTNIGSAQQEAIPGEGQLIGRLMAGSQNPGQPAAG